MRDLLKRFFIHAGDDLSDILKPVNLVAGIYALGGITDLEINAALETGFGFKDRHADLLGHAGINGGFKNNYASWHKIASYGAARSLYRRKIWRVIVVHRRGNGDYVKARLAQARFVGCEFNAAVLYRLVADLAGRVYAVFVCIYLFLICVKAYYTNLL